MTADPSLRVLAGAAAAPHISRRALLGGFAVAGASAALAACGPTGSIAASAHTDGKTEKQLNVYSWGDYDDPANIAAFSKRGITVQLDSYSSNEELIAKLGAARGTSGYDVVVPTGNYIPMMAKNRLLTPLDHSLLPNLANVEKVYREQAWDPDSTYAVCKNWGTTGFVYDTTKISGEPRSWADFLELATTVARGKTSVLEDSWELASIYFGANGIDPNTTKKVDLDACEKYLVESLAPGIRAFSSNPAQNIVQADFTLMQSYNGDARQGMINSDDPERWKFVFPTPTANIWMDTWAIARGTQHPDSAHAFINYMLQPGVGAKEMDYNGYPTGLVGQEAKAHTMKVDLPELIFPSPEVLDRLTAADINSAQGRLVDILNRVQAKAGA